MSKHRCKCGNYRSCKASWRVIERRERPLTSQLKCLVCGWKWWSKCKYVARLQDHKERSRSGMTDDDILYRLLDGTLQVCEKGTYVRSFSTNNGWRNLKFIEHRGDNGTGSTYRFVKVTFQSKMKKIAVHRLVWMDAHKRTVPTGFDIDHVKGKSVEYPDGIHNLRLLESLANQTRGYVSPTRELPF